MNGLSDMGRGDMAWLLATNKSYPSWGYMTEHGATTIWELWNGDTANPSMNSHNHVMLLGDLLTWLYERVIGIAADEENPGFKHIIMRPDFNVDEINFISESYESIYGAIRSNWKKVNGKLHWDIAIPANTTATITLPERQEVQDLLRVESGIAESMSNAKKRKRETAVSRRLTNFALTLQLHQAAGACHVTPSSLARQPQEAA